MLAKAGITPQDAIDMDEIDKATVIRGYELRTHDMQWMIRWLGSVVWSGATKKATSPEKLLKLRCDRKKSASTGSMVRKKIDESQNIFELWDSTPSEKWKVEVIK
jgi:hypothetical protein